MSVDPLSPKYPELTPYQFASNSPIYLIDIDGLEGGHIEMAGSEPHLKLAAKEEGVNLYQTKAFKSYQDAQAKAFVVGAAVVVSGALAYAYWPAFLQLMYGGAAALSTPRGQQLALEGLDFVTSAAGCDGADFQAPGPGGEMGKAIKFIFNKNGAKVGQLFAKQLDVISRSSLFGGNGIALHSDKTTSILGKIDDIYLVRATGHFTVGQNTGGLNILLDKRWAKWLAESGGDVGKFAQRYWDEVNLPWLQEGINRGDVFRFVSDPNNPANLYTVTKSGEKVLSFMGREVEHLKKNGYEIIGNEAVKK